MEDGSEVFLYTLKNDDGMEVSITNYGGIVTSIVVPDKDGNMEDVVLGFDDFEKYKAGHPYFGAITGRYANRIAAGRFARAADSLSQPRASVPEWTPTRREC